MVWDRYEVLLEGSWAKACHDSQLTISGVFKLPCSRLCKMCFSYFCLEQAAGFY